MIERFKTVERLGRGFTKLLYKEIWKVLASRAKSPDIEVLYQNDTDGIVCCFHGPAYIEPVSGYIISEDGYLLADCFLNCPGIEPLNYHVPSPFRFLNSRHNPKKTISVPEVISVRYFYEWNYYHFYFDVISKLELLQIAGVSMDLPFALAKYVNDVKFARVLIERGDFAKYHWLNPDTKYIRAEKVIYCKSTRPYKSKILFIRQALQIEDAELPGTLRIFLNRSSRCVANFKEILPVLSAHGFQVVDAATMSIDEQLDIFSSVQYLVTVHGAGTTNIIFRGENPLSVLELHSDRYINFDHKRICTEMGYRWDSLAGKSNPGKNSLADFYISPEELDKKIVEMLAPPLLVPSS